MFSAKRKQFIFYFILQSPWDVYTAEEKNKRTNVLRQFLSKGHCKSCYCCCCLSHINRSDTNLAVVTRYRRNETKPNQTRNTVGEKKQRKQTGGNGQEKVVSRKKRATDKIGFLPGCFLDKIRHGCFHVREGLREAFARIGSRSFWI